MSESGVPPAPAASTTLPLSIDERAELARLRRENAFLRARLDALEHSTVSPNTDDLRKETNYATAATSTTYSSNSAAVSELERAASVYTRGHSLTRREISRYGRQLIMPELGVAAQ